MKNLFLFCITALFLFSCGGNDEENISQEEIDAALAISNYNPIVLETGGIKLTEFTDFPPFDDVGTKISTQNQTFKLGINKIEFENALFNLGQKTAEEDMHGVRLNESGQYLGVLKPNGDVLKVIQSDFETDVLKGKNLFFCYLSRSYDLSLKNRNSSFLFKINADPAGCFSETNLSDTVVALLQPRGDFEPILQDKVLFDFYLKNVDLTDGKYVELSIDKVVFKIKKWAPFWISGLTQGKHLIKIDLKTKDGKSIEGIMPNQRSTVINLKSVEIFNE